MGDSLDAGATWSWEALAARCLRETSRLLRAPQDAQDAAQEALLRAWRQRHQCAQPDTPEPWVAQIARREALRVLQRNRAQTATPLHEDDGVPLAVEDAAIRRLPDRVDLQRVLEDLPARDRALALVHYSADVSQVTLARSLGLPEPTMRVQIHRMRKRLRLALAGAPGDAQPS